MTIKDGYDDKPCHIRVDVERGDARAHVTIEQDGLAAKPGQRGDTLSFATLDEVIALRDECNHALRVMTGL